MFCPVKFKEKAANKIYTNFRHIYLFFILFVIGYMNINNKNKILKDSKDEIFIFSHQIIILGQILLKQRNK